MKKLERRKEYTAYSGEAGYRGSYKDWDVFSSIYWDSCNSDGSDYRHGKTPGIASNGSDEFDPEGMDDEAVIDEIERRSKPTAKKGVDVED